VIGSTVRVRDCPGEGGENVIGEYERESSLNESTRRMDRTDACHSLLWWFERHGYPPLLRHRAHESCILLLPRIPPAPFSFGDPACAVICSLAAVSIVHLDQLLTNTL